MVSTFFWEKIDFLAIIVLLLKEILWELYWRFFSSVFDFGKIAEKVAVKENVIFTDYASGIRLSDCSKLVINWKNDSDATICRHDVIFQFCCYFFVSLVNFSYWSKFHLNIITGSAVLTIYFYKELTRNLEILTSSVWVLLNIRRLERVGDTKFGKDVSNKMLLNDAKCQGYSFNRLRLLPFLSYDKRETPLPPLPQPRLVLKLRFHFRKEVGSLLFPYKRDLLLYQPRLLCIFSLYK